MKKVLLCLGVVLAVSSPSLIAKNPKPIDISNNNIDSRIHNRQHRMFGDERQWGDVRTVRIRCYNEWFKGYGYQAIQIFNDMRRTRSAFLENSKRLTLVKKTVDPIKTQINEHKDMLPPIQTCYLGFPIYESLMARRNSPHTRAIESLEILNSIHFSDEAKLEANALELSKKFNEIEEKYQALKKELREKGFYYPKRVVSPVNLVTTN